MKKVTLILLVLIISGSISSQDIPDLNEIIPSYYGINNTDDQVLLLDSGNAHFFVFSSVDSILMLKSYFDFDDNGLLIQDSSIMLLSDILEWVYSDKNVMEYNSHKALIMETVYIGDWTNPIWYEDERMIYHYPQGDTLIKYELMNNWDQITSSWENSDSSYYIYNIDGMAEHEFEYHWDHDLYIYQKRYKHNYVYDNLLLTSDTIFSYWNGFEEYSSLKLYDYDSNGNRIKRESLFWNGTSNFLPGEKHEYNYDVNNNRTKTIRFDWDTDNSSWFKIEETHLYYDEENNLDMVMYWELDDIGTMEKQWSYKFFYSYHTVVGKEEEQPIKSFSAFPIPSNGVLKINSSHTQELLLMDINGKIIKRLYVNAGILKLDLSNLVSSVYLLISEDGSYQQKIVIQ